jgi:hypothetical protein
LEKKLRLLFRDERYKKYSTVGVFEGLKGWVCLGDITGSAKIFHIDNHHEVSHFSDAAYDQVFEFKASDGLTVNYYTTVSKCDNSLFVLSQGVHPKTSLSVISMKSVFLINSPPLTIEYILASVENIGNPAIRI